LSGKLEVQGAIFSKNFRHNLIGTSTLGHAGISTLMHEGKVYLIDEKSVKQLPNIGRSVPAKGWIARQAFPSSP
jgi:hypothetical protein